MITFLEGKLVEKSATRIVINVQGVGYEVMIPLSSYDKLPPPDETCHILTHDHVREDTHLLFGFATSAERELFTCLLGISGIGPKLALSTLSGISVKAFKLAVIEGDVRMLNSISGIGKKTAERIVIELRDKLSASDAPEAITGADDAAPKDARTNDAIMALISLGYKQNDAWKMIRKVIADLEPDATVEEIIRQALVGKT